MVLPKTKILRTASLCYGMLMLSMPNPATALLGTSSQDLQDVWTAQLAASPEDGGCNAACNIFNQLNINQVSVKNTTSYEDHKDSYWSDQQRTASPACFVEPTCADDVATIIKVARLAQCPFAVKSGGHAAFEGASSSNGGITIILRLLNEVTVSADKSVTRVGTGNRWIDVYGRLEPHGLSVIGGRVADIGTGGLTLGGGISFFSGRRGWACDNVLRYEVVTADSEILEVTHESHPDLYWALRGGGNNFGVVTRMDLETFPQGDIWGGAFISTLDHNVTLLDALSNFAENYPKDPDAGCWVAFAATPQGWIISTELTHGKGEVKPESLSEFLAVPSIHSTVRKRSLTNLTLELVGSQADGLRESYWTATFKNSRPLLQHVFEIYYEEMAPFRDLDGIVMAAIYQPIGKNVLKHMNKRGGNSLGIDHDEDPLINLNVATMWSPTVSAEDEEALMEAMRRVIDRSTAKAEEMNAAHRYLYQNYAAASQKIFEGYGKKNHKRLREISHKYDPEQVFQKLQPGYFKL